MFQMHQGSCHCGRVTFEVEATLDDVADCNCSLGRRRGALWHLVSDPALRIKSREGDLVLYPLHSRTETHYSGGPCGVHPFIRPRIDPGRWVVNVRWLEGVDLSAPAVRSFDGVHRERAAKACSQRRETPPVG